ncbi:MAG: DUF4114 domain-containing protein [Reyranella sp.]
MLERANGNDPTLLLNADWASRQKQLALLEQNGTLWATYGADPSSYQEVRNDLTHLGFTLFPEGVNQQYVSSAESRTVWIQVDQTNFETLFGSNAAVHEGKDESGQDVLFWHGNLSLPDNLIALGVQGIWFDTGALSRPLLADPGGGNAVPLVQGPQGPGNDHPGGQLPNDVAAGYNFPFSSAGPFLSTDVATGRVGLLEPGIGDAMPFGAPQTFDQALESYRQTAGVEGPMQPTLTISPGGQLWAPADERALDVGVVTAVNPRSQLVLYAGSGYFNGASADALTAYQSAFWDTVNDPEVVSSSYKSFPHIAPGSPFHATMQDLFMDAALRNVTAVNAAGDGGSGDEYANGFTNVTVTHASPYSLVVGGGSLSTVASAAKDTTLADIYARAIAGDPATIWQLAAGGLTVLPSSADPAVTLIETAWNDYIVSGTEINGYLSNFAGSGGVDPSQPQPSYQTDFGLDLRTADPHSLTGRGIPDVSATSGGNTAYTVPRPDMLGTTNTGGTSGAAPLWAALISQFNAIFHDQGLPQLGYANDLLYMAAVVAPAAFNDITLGNNTSSLTLGGAYSTGGVDVTPTGYGYTAGPGYDLTTGLGSPNGVLLARALTAIAHGQWSFASNPDIVDEHASGVLRTPVAQTLLIQTMAQDATTVGLVVGSDSISFTSAPSAPFAWTSGFAQQSLQADFDPDLVRLFDAQQQGVLAQSLTASGDRLTLSIDGTTARAPQLKLSSSAGFVDFASEATDGVVRVARAVAVAETVGALDDQSAIVRIRQNGVDDLSLTLYRVDDLDGAIAGLKPGDSGYLSAVQSRAYQMAAGGTSIQGPGYGNYVQAELRHVSAGDLVAMTLTNDRTGDVYFAFSQANETVNGQPVGHLWSYGLNAWGWEDTKGGGDRDYNDLVVGLDFTSAYGHGWLV